MSAAISLNFVDKFEPEESELNTVSLVVAFTLFATFCKRTVAESGTFC